MIPIRALTCLSALALASTALAQAPAPRPEQAVQRIPAPGPGVPLITADPAAARAPIAPRRFVTHHDGIFAGRKLSYTVVAADTVLTDPLGEPRGSIFSFSYVADRPDPRRPVLFVFNGGPGSSSVWLHMGLLGPRKVAYRDVTPAQVPPFDVVDNPDSVLAIADLVFIDPVGTGFSRYWGKGRPADFYGSEADAAATVQFVERWLRANGRWGSPKFVLGESYGTQRAALLSRRLMGGFMDGTLHGIALNGIVLVGGDGGLARPGGPDAFLVGFTTQAATAWHHGRVDRAGRTFDAFVAAADRFARDRLVPALAKGAALPPAERHRIAVEQTGFVGLPVAFIEGKGLAVTQDEFARALLADRGELIGTYDTRYVLPTANSLGDPVADDPAMGQYGAVFAGALNRYVRDELKVAIDEDYVLIDWANVNMAWNYDRDHVDPGADLAGAMRRNPDLYLMSAQGWFDLFGAVGTSRYGIAQRGLPADRVVQHAYYSGHMCYVGEAGAQMAADLKAFILTAAGGRPQQIPGATPR